MTAKLSHWFVPLFAAFFVMMFVSTLGMSQSAHAGGAVGGGGGATGGNGGARTRYGFGFYEFNTDGSSGSPSGTRSGGQTWSDIQASCRAAGAANIVAFIIQTPAQTIAQSVVYNYSSSSYWAYYGYRGDSGAPWESFDTARSQFDQVPAVYKGGYVFGSNVAWFCYNFQPPPWNVTPIISANKSTAAPGDTITWTHSVTNNGPSSSAGISYGYNSGGSPFGPTAIGNGGTISSNSTYTVTQNDVGNSICRATYAQPMSSSDGGVIASGSSCVTIPYSYTLTPSVTIDRTNTASVGTPVSVMPAVTNSGPTKSQVVGWQVTEFTVSPGNTPPAGGISGNAPCSFFTAKVTSCTSPLNNDQGNTIFDGSVTGRVSNSSTPLTATSYSIPDLPVGSRVCFALSVKPNSASDTKWRHSPPVCVVVSKSPLVHIFGGDLRVGAAFVGNTAVSSQITTSITIKTGTSYGSWAEYGIAASGTITGMASGSAYSGGLVCAANCVTNTLTFANTPTIGNFTPKTAIPDVAALFPVTVLSPTFSSLADANTPRVETASGPVSINGGTIKKRTWLVINAPTSTVTITGDINYDPVSLQSPSDIPQLVIIANQINIEGNVKNVDAWLIASGTTGAINTCSAWKGAAVGVNDNLSSDICSDQLVINGPVMAKKLYLRRTAGADSGSINSDNSAEVINLRPDAYLWGLARVSQSSRLTTVYETELPPRF